MEIEIKIKTVAITMSSKLAPILCDEASIRGKSSPPLYLQLQVICLISSLVKMES